MADEPQILALANRDEKNARGHARTAFFSERLLKIHALTFKKERNPLL
jgi:hypothetical protein